MSSRQERQDYFTANRLLFDELASAFEAALRLDPSRVLLYKTAGEDFTFVEGEYAPEEMAVLNPPALNPEEAAEEQNELLRDYANSSLRSLRGLANFLRPGDLPPLFGLDGRPVPLPYESAVCRRIELSPSDEDDPTLDGKVGVLELFKAGPKHEIESAARYESVVAVRGIKEVLSLTLINGKAEFINYDLGPAEDPLYGQCRDMFGPGSKAMDLLVGKFETEDELESTLATIATATKGIYPDGQVQTLLDAIRERALRDRQFQEWDVDFDVKRPPHEKIRELAGFLRSITE